MLVRFWGTRGSIPVAMTSAEIKRKLVTALVAAAGRGLDSAGREGMFRSMLQVQKQLYAEGKGTAYALAETYAWLGDSANSMAYLKLSLARHEEEIVNIALAPCFGRMHRSAELQALASQVGLQKNS